MTSSGRSVELNELLLTYFNKVKKIKIYLLQIAVVTLLKIITETGEPVFDIAKSLRKVRRRLKHSCYLTKHKHYT